MECSITFDWNEDANVWTAQSNQIRGFVLEAASFDALLARVRSAVPALSELNGEARTRKAAEEESEDQHSMCAEKFAMEVSVSALMNPRGRAAASLEKLSRKPACDFERAKLGEALEKWKNMEA